jgi:hypothetical protein
MTWMIAVRPISEPRLFLSGFAQARKKGLDREPFALVGSAVFVLGTSCGRFLHLF